MKRREFNEWFSNFKDHLRGYDYYVDFPKVYKNVEEIRISLNIMNSLIGSKTIEEDFDSLLDRYPEIIECIPILIAVRLKDVKNELKILDKLETHIYDFNSGKNTPEEYKIFMRKTGLFDLISNHLVSNMVDYVLGIETGLDSNARKNRGGKIMEELVKSFIEETGCVYNSEYTAANIQKRYGIDLSSLSNDGKSAKRFDFVVESSGHIYAIEVNFYSSQGSKLNETARSYKMLAEEAKNINNFTFVWITDGAGWKSARRNLEETFDTLDTLYCIDDLENGILYELFKCR